MNKIILVGRLTKNPEAKFSSKGTKFVTFTLAVDDGYGDNKTTDFFDSIVGGKTADAIEKYCVKGTKILVDGTMHIRNVTDQNGRQTRFPQVKVESVEFLDNKPSGNGATVGVYQQPLQQSVATYPQNNGGYQQPVQPAQPVPPVQPAQVAQPRSVVTEDDLPF